VGVDQAGGEDGFRPVEALLRLEASVDFGFRADGYDSVGTHGDGPVFDNSVVNVFGDDVAGAPDPINAFGSQRRDAKKENSAGLPACARQA